MAYQFSSAALDLIVNAEGLDQPGQWPGGDSGVTIGIGDDLGYQSAAEFSQNWQPILSHDVYIRLLDAVGFKGEHAHGIAHHLGDIRITQDQANSVFLSKTLPHYVDVTRRAFPGFERLPIDAQGVLVSLVYNRGTKMDGDRRREMRAIRDEVAKPRPSMIAIAGELRAMKRLWIGQGLDGLIARREAEARLVERAMP